MNQPGIRDAAVSRPGHRASRSRRFLLGMLGGIALWMAAWAALVAGQLCQPFVNNLWVDGSYDKKLVRAQAIEVPKLVVAAGSGAMFGLSSPQLAEALGRPTVNLSVNAGILTPYLLSHARQAVKPGDWVLLPIEYVLFYDRTEVNQVYLDYWLSHPTLDGLNPVRVWNMIWQLPLERVVRGYRGLPPGVVVSGLYGPQNQNEHGDQMNSAAAQRGPDHAAIAEKWAVETYGKRAAQPGTANWAAWRDFAREVDAAGGCAVFVPVALFDRPAYHDDPVEKRFYDTLADEARAQGLRYVGRPADFFYPVDDFFDTNFHLTAEARTRHTQAIIDLVREPFQTCGKR